MIVLRIADPSQTQVPPTHDFNQTVMHMVWHLEHRRRRKAASPLGRSEQKSWSYLCSPTGMSQLTSCRSTINQLTLGSSMFFLASPIIN